MNTLALDIGGANIKAAHSDGTARSQSFAMWQKPNELTTVLRELVNHTPGVDRILLTLTGELCDCFESRNDGVEHIIRSVEAMADGRHIAVWSIDAMGFVPCEKALQDPLSVASANWHALATFWARAYPDRAGLMIDVGSTTTDLVRLANGQPIFTGRCDRDRLATGELVYTGVQRTPIAAVAQQITWRRKTFGVAAEAFAFMSDVYILLKLLPTSADDTDTADGRPRTPKWCANRILRMIGSDLGMNDQYDATELAELFVDAQCERIVGAARQVFHGDVDLNRSDKYKLDCESFFISGSGEFAAQRVARMLNPQAEIVMLSDTISPRASEAACAHALLQLDKEIHRHG